DPHGLEQYRMNLKEEAIEADLVLISHPHSDHSNLAVIKGYKGDAKDKKDDKEKKDKEDKEDKKVEPKFKLLYGVDPKTRDWNKINETVKDVKVYAVPTFHDKVEGLDKGKNGVFVIEVDGLRIVHLGDLGHVLTDKQVQRIKGQANADDPGKP